MISGGTAITIVGTNFSSDKTQDSVTLDSLAATIASASATQLVVTTPAHAEADVPLSVTVGGLSSSNTLTFSYLPLTSAGYYSSDGLGPGTPASPGFYVPDAGLQCGNARSGGLLRAGSRRDPGDRGLPRLLRGRHRLERGNARAVGYYVPDPGATQKTPADPGYYVPAPDSDG